MAPYSAPTPSTWYEANIDIIDLFVPRPSLLACSVAIPKVARNFGLIAVSGAPSFATVKTEGEF